MEQRTVKVTINGEAKEYPCKITYGEIVKDYENTAEAPIILVMVNGKLRELHKHLKDRLYDSVYHDPGCHRKPDL